MWKSNETKLTPCFVEMRLSFVCVSKILISPHVHLHITTLEPN